MAGYEVWPTNYYISNQGNDNENGTSPSNAWQSISKANSMMNVFDPGDSIYFERGSEFYEQLNITASGTANALIVFSDYGYGNKPVINGLLQTNSWELYNNNIYALHVTSKPNYVFQNGQRLRPSRWPETGYSFPESQVNSNTFSDNELNLSNINRGATCHIKTKLYRIYHRDITNYAINNKNLTIEDDLDISTNYGYFITGVLEMINKPGDWAYDADANLLYLWPVDDINSTKIEIGYRDYGIVTGSTANYIEINNIHIKGTHYAGIDINSDYVIIKDNYLDYHFNKAIQVDNADNVIIENNSIYYAESFAIWSENSNDLQVNKNYIYGTGTTELHGDVLNGRGTAIYTFRTPRVKIYNNKIEKCGRGGIFISGNVGRERVVSYNLIKDVMLSSGDGGAIYNDAKKNGLDQYDTIKYNIILNVPGSAEGSISSDPHAVGIYIDNALNYSDTDNGYFQENWLLYKNTIAGTYYGIYLHDARSCFVDSNLIYDCAYQLYTKDVLWSSNDYRMDEIYLRKNIFLSGNSSQMPVYHNSDRYSDITVPSESDDNYYINPYSNDVIRRYTTSGGIRYKLGEWQNAYNMDHNSSVMSDITTEEIFDMAVIYNDKLRDTTIVFNYGCLDVDGNNIQSLTLKPFESELVFIMEEVDEEETNNPPYIENHIFNIDNTLSINSLIGIIEASDPDAGQTLAYSVINGNEDNYFSLGNDGSVFLAREFNISEDSEFRLTAKVEDNYGLSDIGTIDISVTFVASDIDQESNSLTVADQTFEIFQDNLNSNVVGQISVPDNYRDQPLTYLILDGNDDHYFNLDYNTGEITINNVSLLNFFQDEDLRITVQVQDNSDTKLTDTAIITFKLAPSKNTCYIDPGNLNDPQKNGSKDHPFSSWKEVNWQYGYYYLQKCGTQASEDKILVIADNVTLGAYGSGQLPEIISAANDFSIKLFERSNVTIQNLEINAPDAIACIYFIGWTCDNNNIERCEFTGAEYGIRIIEGKRYSIQYNIFSNKTNAIYTLAEDNSIYYNIFKYNSTSINIVSYLSSARVFNNVFYGNSTGLSSSYASLTVYNNIFYLINPGDVAINASLDKLISDYNVFYPEQYGFVKLDELNYMSLLDYQTESSLDKHSFSEDPLFYDTTNEDFTLKPESPSIDAGKFVGIFEDFYGLNVPQDNAPDIGIAEAALKKGQLMDLDSKSSAEEDNYCTLFPNPSPGIFNIQVNNLDLDNMTLDIKNMTGNTVYSKTLDTENISIWEKIDITEHLKGVYFVIINIDGKVTTQKIIIQ